MQIKLIIWDLDDTLWRGTLAEGDRVDLIESRADLIKAFNDRGVVSSISSKNDPKQAERKLRVLGLWDQFVFPNIAFEPKAGAIAGIIGDMRLRAANVLFIDDNPHNLHAARHLLPDLNILDANAADADDVLDALLAAQPAHSGDRLAKYRILERKARDLANSSGSNEDFLRQCSINICAPFLMDNLDFVPRIAELINRSNQLNYTQSRVEEGELTAAIIDVVRFDSWSIFAWDRYGHHGLVGFVMVDRAERALVHFAFSCRMMHMGLEQAVIAMVREKWPDLDVANLAVPFEDRQVDWITVRPFGCSEIRESILSELHSTDRHGAKEGGRQIRIMFDCQSGGIAHFSRNRARLDFDNAPRAFSMRDVVPGLADPFDFPSTLVYGAGIDYSDPRWPGADHLLDGGLYDACVDLFCEKVASSNSNALVILPPEDAEASRYRDHMGHTWRRTCDFNQIWRKAAERNPNIELLDLTGFVTDADMPDVSHYKAGFLKKLADRVDTWIEQKNPVREIAAA